MSLKQIPTCYREAEDYLRRRDPDGHENWDPRAHTITHYTQIMRGQAAKGGRRSVSLFYTGQSIVTFYEDGWIRQHPHHKGYRDGYVNRRYKAAGLPVMYRLTAGSADRFTWGLRWWDIRGYTYGVPCWSAWLWRDPHGGPVQFKGMIPDYAAIDPVPPYETVRFDRIEAKRQYKAVRNKLVRALKPYYMGFRTLDPEMPTWRQLLEDGAATPNPDTLTAKYANKKRLRQFDVPFAFADMAAMGSSLENINSIAHLSTVYNMDNPEGVFVLASRLVRSRPSYILRHYPKFKNEVFYSAMVRSDTLKDRFWRGEP